MLGASWAQRRTCSLRLARSIQPRCPSARHIALPIPKFGLQDAAEHFLSPSNTLPMDRPRGPRYSTSISSVAEQAVALLRAKKIEEAAGILSQFPEGDSNHALVVEVVNQFLDSSKGVKDSENLFLWLESFPDANNASSDAFHQIFDQLIGHDDGDWSLLRRFGLLCASKGYQDFVAVHVTPTALKWATDSEAAQWDDEVSLATAEFKGLQRSVDGVLEDDGLDYALAPPTMAQVSTIIQQIEETLPAVLPATPPNEDSVFEEDGPEYVASATPLYSESTQSRVDRVIEELVRDGKWDDAYTFLLEIQQTGRHPSLGPCTTAIQALLDHLLDTSKPTADKTAARAQYLDWVRALPPALSPDNMPFASHLIRTLFRTDIRISPLAHDTAVILASKGYTPTIFPHISRVYCTHPDSPISTDFVVALEDGHRKFCEKYFPEVAETRTKSLHRKLRSSIIRNLATIGSFSQALLFFPDASEGYIYGYELILRHIRAAGPAAVAEYESQVLSRVPKLPDQMYAALPDGSDLAVSYNWLANAFNGKRASPHPMAILDFINAFLASDPPNSAPLTQLLNKAMGAGPLHTSAFLYAEMLYYYRKRNYDAVIETVDDHMQLGYGMPRRIVQHMRERMEEARVKNGSIVENSGSYRFHDDKGLLNIPYKIWAPTIICNIVWHTYAVTTREVRFHQRQYDLLVNILERVKDGMWDMQLRDPGAKVHYFPNGDAFIPLMKRLMAAKGPKVGTRIINDIVRLGLQPKAVHFSELAYAYAMSGAPEPALTILRKLEAGFDKVKKVKEGGETKERVPFGSPQNINTLPMVPDVRTYAYLAAAFVKAGRVEDAEAVLSRLETYLKEEAEGDQYVATVHRRLEQFKHRQRAASKKAGEEGSEKAKEIESA